MNKKLYSTGHFEHFYDFNRLIELQPTGFHIKTGNLLLTRGQFRTAFEKNEYLKDIRYLQMAKIWSKNSKCKRKQVGALIVKDNMIISDGYNGTPHGMSNVCEDDEGNTSPIVLHAEANAITKIAKSTNSSEGSTLYVTLSPCFECSKLIIQSGIKKLVFSELYRVYDGLNLLVYNGIEILYLPWEAIKNV